MATHMMKNFGIGLLNQKVKNYLGGEHHLEALHIILVNVFLLELSQ